MILPTGAAGFCPDVTTRQKVGGAVAEREGKRFVAPLGGVNWGWQSTEDAVGEPGCGDKDEMGVVLEKKEGEERKERRNVPEYSRPRSDVGVRG